MKRANPIKTSIDVPETSTYEPTEGHTTTCTICQAVYAPSRSHMSLQQASPIALESAFMSMCHFCFRCRRPSCPNCWDDINHVCAQCTQEMLLPFRTTPTPLQGTFPLPSRPTPPTPQHPIAPSLISLHPGRFQTPPPLTPHNAANYSEHPPVTSHIVKAEGTISTSSPLDIDMVATRPDRTDLSVIDTVTTHPDHTELPDIDTVATRPDRDLPPQQPTTPSQHTSHTITYKITRLLTIIVLLLLFCVLALITTTLLSLDANTLALTILHIDIRATLSSLWHFLQNLF